ncbi:MAG: AmmeMemoRadiSam system radical SAM enzyme [Candidatus Aenigmarchaeota archaeon]|nr:AmmeMemoRadiSam system radical SAM enzyme [Candidatus Aenigmarchaeota archaeon]MDW8149484.1 AmmeMemoRadiSam system radical SAM enzyme [Candidatus Aenigmarchaeota archaeon]
MVKKARLFEKVNESVVCKACARKCILSKGQIGFCGVRKNIGGNLYLLVYGKVIACNIDPIEKKPVMHYMPGSRIFSIGTTGCSWACAYCLNFDISQRREISGIEMSPKEIVEGAISNNCQGIAYTYNEPSIFIEFASDVGRIAKKKGLINIFVTNGFYTEETVKEVKKFLNCATIDIKGNANLDFVRKYILIQSPQPIFDTLLQLKNSIHIEVTDLIIPKIGDDTEDCKKLCKFLFDNFGPDLPLHFLRFHPDYKLLNIPQTPIETLEKHHKIAREIGFNYVYIGNVWGHPYENTYCPECNNVVIGRFGFSITSWNLDDKNNCKFCGYKIKVFGRPIEKP